MCGNEMRGPLHIRQKRHFRNKIKTSKERKKIGLVGGRMTWMEEQDMKKKKY